MKFKKIIDPIPTEILKKELRNSAELLGETSGDIEIYLVRKWECPNLMDEIARLREITFRTVGESIGKEKDTDQYDNYYDQITLWHKVNEEIVGAYRMGATKEIYRKHGYDGLYNYKIYDFHPDYDKILNQGLEMGRSFIQEKYWGSNALDFLWNGIAIYLKKFPDIRYLFGVVSMSDDMSQYGHSLIVGYYTKWFMGSEKYVTARTPFITPDKYKEKVNEILSSTDYKKDFRNIKKELLKNGESVPVLYRRYSEMTEYGGAKFYGFSINPSFNNAVDSLIIVDLTKIRPQIRDRYFNNTGFVRQTTSD